MSIPAGPRPFARYTNPRKRDATHSTVFENEPITMWKFYDAQENVLRSPYQGNAVPASGWVRAACRCPPTPYTRNIKSQAPRGHHRCGIYGYYHPIFASSIQRLRAMYSLDSTQMKTSKPHHAFLTRGTVGTGWFVMGVSGMRVQHYQINEIYSLDSIFLRSIRKRYDVPVRRLSNHQWKHLILDGVQTPELDLIPEPLREIWKSR